MKMKLTALLPLKGHSERIPEKNTCSFAGEPLFYKILKSLLNSEYVSEIIVDTDSHRIEEEAMKFSRERIKIIERPIELRGDFVSMNKIIEYDLKHTEGEHFLQTHSTNPLLTTRTIDAAVNKYFQIIKAGYDSLFSVTSKQVRFYDKNGVPINHNPDKLIRTQDLPPVFEENSCIYLFSHKSFNKKMRRIGGNPFLFEIDKYEAIDIDEEIDFLLAEQMFIIRESSR